ncbi:MAG: DEAD/DEAH box helicase [Roseibacillus sp.]
MSELELTRDLLMDAGGWKEMKAAREMHRSGLVREAVYENGWLEGMVSIGGKPRKVRMELISRSHMENKCTCFMARRDGRVCAHAIAVGLEVIEPTAKQEEPVEEEAVAVEDRWPAVTEEFSEESSPVQCRVLLPIRIEPSWERGQLMVGVSTDYEGEEHLLATWGPDYTLYAGERDGTLLRVLKRIFPAQPPGVVNVSRAQFLLLLEALAGHPRVSFGKKSGATVSYAVLRPSLVVKGERVVVEWPAEVSPLVEGGTAWALEGTTFRPVATDVPEALRGIFSRGAILNPIEAPATLAMLSQWFEIDESVVAELPPPERPQVEVTFEGSLNHVEGKMVFLYGAHRRVAGMAEGELIEGEDGKMLASPDLERAAEDVLRQWGFDGPGKRGEFVLRDKQAILRFHAHGIGRLDPEWMIVKGDRFAEFAKDIVPIAPVFEFQGSGEDWFAVEMEYRAGDGVVITREEIQRLLQTGRNDRALSGGRVAVLDPDLTDDVMETIADCEPEQSEPGVFQIDHRQAAYLRQAARELGVETVNEGKRARTGKELELGNLEQTLRPYQREGVEWLWELAELKMGGILADDMGLGKTLQTLAFLKAHGGTSLVVCPSSLIYNWLAEAEKFVPELKAVAIEGSKRAAVLAEAGDADLLVTSYALLRLDIDLYRNRDFEVVVLDEAQQIKNPEAQVSKAACRLPGRHRVALTGTPIENSVKDLWSIMNFVMPGYLGDRSRFAERFEKPLSRGGAPELQRRLARRLKPVVKRRLKREVAADLPAKIEQVRYCELSARQREVYQSILQESRTMIFDAEGGRKRMLALTALLRLRQACCDLRLLNLPEMEDKDGSVKMGELESLLQEAVEGGHRVLVFSQFVKMLQGMVPMLMENGFGFCYLDGQTKNRGEVVSRFQESPGIPVFLISLKAGGVGLNLTGADTVIHVDPWWNPAVEAQATDRAHRIGQDRVVTSYKLITRNTVEEKILALQERKKELIASTLDAGLPTGGSSLSEGEILELFA